MARAFSVFCAALTLGLWWGPLSANSHHNGLSAGFRLTVHKLRTRLTHLRSESRQFHDARRSCELS
jgi:hypothetical protein